jgi:lauroyl/myristoyl acyltransferase
MQRAGVYRRGLENEHLERAGDQMESLMHILRAGYPDSGVGERFCFDESLRNLHQAHDAGRGVLVLSPHLCGYAVFARVLAEHVPTSIYLRRSPDRGRHALNVLMGQAGGGDLVFPPLNAPPAQRLNVAISILRKRRALYVTPDLPRKANQGVPVTIWNRTVYFPTGVTVMAMRTGSPMYRNVVFPRGTLPRAFWRAYGSLTPRRPPGACPQGDAGVRESDGPAPAPLSGHVVELARQALDAHSAQAG